MSQAELGVLKSYVREAHPRNIDDTTVAVFKYFRGIHWSILKDEWKLMTLRQKADFCESLHKDMNK